MTQLHLQKALNLVTLLVLIFNLITCNQPETIKEFDKNGTLISETQLINGKKNGKMITYFPTGRIKRISNYKDDILEGQQITYFENGQVADKVIYSNGNLNGEYFAYYSNGNLGQRGFYLNNLRVGLLFEYDKEFKDRLKRENYVINVEGTEYPYYIKEFDDSGNLIKDERQIKITIDNSSASTEGIIGIEFKLIDSINYDSAFVFIGDFDNEFKPLSRIDTIYFKGNFIKHNLKIKSELESIKGGWIGVKKYGEDQDSTYHFMNFGFFEEKINLLR